MPAELISRLRDVTPDGNLIEMVVWRVPIPVPGCKHDYKYRLAYIVDGRRVVGFDNERGKGDHCHVGGLERPYSFVGIAELTEDFISEVEKWRSEH